jgi:hypothetical protein
MLLSFAARWRSRRLVLKSRRERRSFDASASRSEACARVQGNQNIGASCAAVLRDLNDLKLLTECAGDIPNSFVHQEPCHWRYEGNRTGLRVCFVP